MTAWLFRVVGSLIHGNSSSSKSDENVQVKEEKPIKSLPPGRKRKFENGQQLTLQKIAKLTAENERSTQQKNKVESFACPWCPFKSKGHIHFRDHLQMHMGGLWPCSCCIIKKFKKDDTDDPTADAGGPSSSSAVEKILDILERPQNCPNCISLCRQAFQLKIHLQTQRRNLTAIKCSECEFKAATHGILQVHIIRCHTPLECDLCDFSVVSSDKNGLTAHIRTHYGKGSVDDSNKPDPIIVVNGPRRSRRRKKT